VVRVTETTADHDTFHNANRRGQPLLTNWSRKIRSIPRFNHVVRQVPGNQGSKQLSEPPRPEQHVMSRLDVINGPPSVIKDHADFEVL